MTQSRRMGSEVQMPARKSADGRMEDGEEARVGSWWMRSWPFRIAETDVSGSHLGSGCWVLGCNPAETPCGPTRGGEDTHVDSVEV